MTTASGPWDIFVVTAPGLEEITAAEMAALGLPPEGAEAGGLGLQGNASAVEALNLHLRTASRVLVRVAEFRAVGFQDLERRGRSVPWGDFLPPGTDPARVEIEVTCRKSRLYHTGAVEARLRDAMAAEASSRARERSRAGAAPDPRDALGPVPPPRFVARLFRNRLTLSADSSGAHLHRRGYREAVGRAPLRETVAAALLLASDWARSTPLLDPFCGSGTLPIEAALLAWGIPPGARRRFAFEGWPGTRRERDGEGRPGWERTPEVHPLIRGTDRDAGAIRSAQANAERAGVADRIGFLQASLSDAPFPSPPGLLVTNPPYGRRVGEAATLRNLYARLGARLRQEWSGGEIVLLSADRALTAQLGMETRVLFRTRNGGIPVEAVGGRVP